MPQDEDSVMVDSKGHLAVGGNLTLIPGSPPQIQANVAYGPFSNCVLIANTSTAENSNKYTIGGGYYKKFPSKSTRYFRYDALAFYSYGIVSNFQLTDFGLSTVEGSKVYLNQIKFQNNISFNTKTTELLIGIRAAFFDINKINQKYGLPDLELAKILQEETKLIPEYLIRFKVKWEFAKITTGMATTFGQSFNSNSYYRPVSIYGGIEFNLVELLDIKL